MFVAQAFAQTETPATPAAAPDAHGSALPVDALHAGVEHPSPEHGGAFPPFNPEFYASQVLWLAIVFGVFYYILSKFIVPQIGGTLLDRRQRVSADLDAASKMKADADAARAAYEQNLAEARVRSHAIASDARENAKTSAEAERKRTEGDLDNRLTEAQARIGDIKSRALGEVDRIAEDVTQSILADVAKLEVSREEAAGAVAGIRR